MARASVTKALIVAPAWVGDMVMAHTLVQVLQHRHGTIEIHMAAPPATASLAKRMPGIQQVHEVDFAHGELGLGKRRAVGRSLIAQNYTAAYVLPNSWKSALLPFFANIPQRIGWSGEARFGLLNDRRKLDKEKYPLMIERFMALGSDTGDLPSSPYPTPQLNVDQENLASLLAQHQLTRDDVTILCPGAEFGAAKKWPHYAELAKRLIAQGGQVWLMGSPKDAEDCTQIEAAVPEVTSLAGKTTLLDAVDLISVAKRAVCNDSGLMHVACALGIPTIGIYGSTSPAFTPPLGPQAEVVQRTLDCRPCFQRECPLKHLDCLQKLPAADVIARIPHA